MTYSITITPTTVTIRKGRIGVRSTTCPQLLGVYASLYSLHGDAILPRLWADMIGGHRTSVRNLMPSMNADYSVITPVMPTSPACSIPSNGPTKQISHAHRFLYKSPTQSSIWQRPGR